MSHQIPEFKRMQLLQLRSRRHRFSLLFEFMYKIFIYLCIVYLQNLLPCIFPPTNHGSVYVTNPFTFRLSMNWLHPNIPLLLSSYREVATAIILQKLTYVMSSEKDPCINWFKYKECKEYWVCLKSWIACIS